jgi:ABC-type transporter Mla subunit MlaD
MRILAPIGIAAAVVTLVVLAAGSGSGHAVFVTVPDATNVVVGQWVREGGQIVGHIGSITPVDAGRAVRLRLDVEDSAWPLPRGTAFSLRWGGTVSYDNRYVALTRGPRSGPPLPDKAKLGPSTFTVPVEFDRLLTAFTPAVRSDVRAMFQRGGDAFDAARAPLASALTKAPPALTEANGVIGDLHANTRALDTLVRSTSGVVAAVHAANPDLRSLLSSAATTFDATAAEAQSLRDTLAQAPVTLVSARRALAHADTTLANAGTLAQRLAPGVVEVRRLAPPLNHVLGTVIDVGPDAKATLATARQATPSLNPLLDRVRALSPTFGGIGTQSVHALKCIRPYTPDIVSFFTNWGDFLSATDGRDKYIRATVQQLVPAPMNATSQTSADIAKAFPGLRYAFPRPPGYNAGQIWFLPECGAGPDALNPAKDPESTHFSPFSVPRLRTILTADGSKP